MWTVKIGLIFIFLTFFHYVSAYKNMRVLVEWKELEFSFPSAAARSDAITGGRYVHGNGVPIDVDVHHKAHGRSRIFVTVPRFTSGIPFSLGTVLNSAGPGGPLLMAYPTYFWHSSHGEDCSGITSVYRVAIDECSRLWVLDTGMIGSVQHCSPQLLVFDLRTDSLINRYKFPQHQFKTGVSLFITPIVDVRDSPASGCLNTKVYIADVTGFGILVYDFKLNTSWRTENKLMYPYADYGTFTIAGESFDLMDGVLGLSLTPKSTSVIGGAYGPSVPQTNERYLYFHPLSGAVENRVPLRLLDNRTIWDASPESNPRDFRTIGTRGTQSAAQAMDSKGNLFFGLMDDIAIAAWNINTPYSRNNMKIVAQNRNTLQFVSGLKVKISRANVEELWALSCRFQKVYLGTKISSEVNFRISGCNIDELLSGGCRTIEHEDNFIFN